MSGAIHAYGGYTQPLLLTGILSLRRFTKSPLFAIHVLGKTAAGENQRPFKPEPSMMQQFMPQTDAAAEPEPAAEAAPAVKNGNGNNKRK